MSRPSVCVWCVRRIESGAPKHEHHLCGRALSPTVVVPVHLACHGAVHRLLHARGIDLRGIADAPPHERARASLHGIAVLLEAAAPVGTERACVRRAVARLDERLAAGFDSGTGEPAPAVPISIAGLRA